jgi:hypothetical protein
MLAEQYEIRAVQLDLARQMETIDFIKEFIQFSANNGFNTLFLYLEARVKTKSFPYAPDDKSYSAEQMKEIVGYASEFGMEVIPGIACLGHAEAFLQYDEMEEIAELRGERAGRFGGTLKQVFCPSQKKTKEFLECYMTEICEIFPSRYIHIGFDEVWDLACCDKCVPNNFDNEQKLFYEHLMFCYDVVVNKLQRQVMIWDDMFEIYPGILKDVPRDIIMVCWQYQNDVRQVEGHFLNHIKRNILQEYNELGFEFLIAPSDGSAANVRTFTQYAEPYKPIGGLVTVWEKGQAFMYRSFPTIAYAGRMWNRSGQCEAKIVEEMVKEIFNCEDKLALQTIRCFIENMLPFEGRFSLNGLLMEDNKGLDYADVENRKLLKQCLEMMYPMIQSDLGKCIYQDINLAYSFRILSAEIRTWAQNMYRNIADDLDEEHVIAELTYLKTERLQQWQKWRTGMTPCHYESLFDYNIKFIRKVPEYINDNGFLSIRFCLPDKYSAEQCRIRIQYQDGWEEVAKGIFKGNVSGDALYSYHFMVDKNKAPKAVRIELWGCGGQGIAYVEVNNNAGCFKPYKINEIEGDVIDSQYLLDNDCKWAFLGEKNTSIGVQDRDAYKRIHSVEIALTN